jgi:hypothetical protein
MAKKRIENVRLSEPWDPLRLLGKRATLKT